VTGRLKNALAGATLLAIAFVGTSPAVAKPSDPRARSAAPAASSPESAEAGTSCRKLPPGKHLVKLNLKPETELGDLIVWISSITCKQFLLPGTIPADSKKVTIVAPGLMSVEEAYRLFLNALDSVGLTVYPTGKFLRVVEVSKAKTLPLPLYLDGQKDPV
jgi:general secretion pathway protein D